MGGGATRQLSQQFTKRDLDPDLKKHLEVALQRLDRMDEKFKESREDEARSQLQKTWADVNIVLVEHLREVGHVMISELQIALDTGSDGGGIGAVPWVEEGTGCLPRLEFRLEDGVIHAQSDGVSIAKGKPSREIPYDWCEKVVTKWIVTMVKKKEGGTD